MKKIKLIIIKSTKYATFLLSVFLLACVLHSCRKDSQSSETTSNLLTLKQSQTLYGADKQSFTGDPVWDKGYVFSQSDTGLTLKIPLAPTLGIKELVFVQYKDKSVHQYVLHTLPDPDYVAVKANTLGKNRLSLDLINISDFTGVIYKFQTDGRFIGGAIYESGSILNAIQPKETKSIDNGGVKHKVMDGNDANCVNPRGPWVQYCQTREQLPPVVIVSPPGGGGYVPPVGTNPPPVIVVGGPTGWPSNLVLYENLNGERIASISEYLKCFDKQQSATVTIYVDQPKAHATDTWAGSIIDPNVGHTFVSITQDNITRTFGFYPSSGVNPYTSPSTTSVLINNGGHGYDISVSTTVSSVQLQSVINASLNFAHTYNLNTYNCTDFGLTIANAAGISIQSSTGTWPGGGGHNPGNFGQDVRNKSLPATSKDSNGGTAPQNKGTCN